MVYLNRILLKYYSLENIALVIMKDKINIMYFIPSLVNSGGMERVLTEKVNYLSRKNKYNIFIVTTDMDEKQKPFFNLNNEIKLIHLSYFYHRNVSESFLKKSIRTLKLNKIYKDEIQSLVKKHLINICISMGGKELEFLGNIKLECVLIYESHFNKNFRSSFLFANGKNNFLWQIVGKLRDTQHNYQAKKMNKIIVLTEKNLSDWKKITQNVEIISNPSPLTKQENELPNLQSKRAIAIGKLDAQKGFDMLIPAWKKVYESFPDWKLDIFGVGEMEEDLKKIIESNQLSTAIKLAGQTRNIKSELLNSSFFVLSSRFEGLPMVLIESITCGLPIVAFDCETGPREIIKNNDCGILVENGNINELANTMKKIIADEELRKKLSTNAIEKSKKYEISNIMNKWEKLFDEEIIKRNS